MPANNARDVQESFRQELDALRRTLEEELEELRKQGQQELERATLRVDEMAQATLEKIREEEHLKDQALEDERRRLDDLVDARADTWKAEFLQDGVVLQVADAMWRYIMPSARKKAAS